MKTCPHCLQDIPEKHQWNGLYVNAMSEAFWQGIKIVGITKQQGDILRVLTDRGEATHLRLEMQAGTPEGNCIKVQICSLRKKLKVAKVPITVENIWGVGFRLKLDIP